MSLDSGRAVEALRNSDPSIAEIEANHGSLDYRAFWTTPLTVEGLLRTVVDQSQTWLREKEWDVDLSWSGTLHHPDGRRLDVRHHEVNGSSGFRLVLEERNPGGRFRTRLTAVDAPAGGWVSLDVLNDEGNYVSTPKLARYLLAALPLLDGQAAMRDVPKRVHTANVHDVQALLADPSRHGACFIAGTDDRLQWDRFADLLGEWTNQVVGLGHVIVLDPDATETFSRAVGRAWQAPAWTIRTYLPRIDLSVTTEARANRILGTERLGNVRDGYLKSLLGRVARQVGASRAIPSDLARWRRTFERLETSAVTSAMRESLKPPPLRAQAERPVTSSQVDRKEPTTEVSELERVKQTLGLGDLSDETLLQLLDSATAAPASDAMDHVSNRMDALQDQVDSLRIDVEARKEDLLDEQLDVLDLQEVVESQQRRMAWLGAELVKLERADLVYGREPEDTDPVPMSYDELVERLPSLEERGVIARCDEATVLGLQVIDHSGKALAPAWQALMALVDFVRARQAGDATGSVHQFLQDQPLGYRTYPVNLHAWTETGTTMERFGDERTFAVPDLVSETGRATMRSHFKLARIARHNPRLYYFDDFANSGLVCVGYIGPHLTNTQT